MKKVLILYATYGSGHKQIAEYIKKHFEESGDCECLALDLISYSVPVIGQLSKKANEFLMTKIPSIWSLVYFSFNNKISAYISGNVSAGIFNNKNLKKIVQEFNPDITIATHFFGTDVINRYNKKGITNSKIITIVTDYHVHNFWIPHIKSIDAIVVGSLEERLYLLSKGVKNSKIHEYGIPILPNFDQTLDRENLLNKFKINNKKKNVLFFVGGGNGALFNLIYFKEILKNNYDCNVLFIAGKSKIAYKKAKEYVTKYNSKNVKVYGFVTNINEFYAVSDFVITKPGGVQITECLFFNKPMILIKSNGGQEVENKRFLCKKEYANCARTRRGFNTYFRRMLNDEYRTRMINNIKKIDHKKSMEKLYNLANKLYK